MLNKLPKVLSITSTTKNDWRKLQGRRKKIGQCHPKLNKIS